MDLCMYIVLSMLIVYSAWITENGDPSTDSDQ